MKVFLSSTFRDLIPERQAVLEALQRKQQAVLAMENFLATSAPSVEVALTALRESDVMILVIGSKAGSLLPDGSGGTYTSAEYDEAQSRGISVLPFLKEEEHGWWPRWTWPRTTEWRNREKDKAKYAALNKFKALVGDAYTWDRFGSPEKLALNVVLALDAWKAQGRPGARKTLSLAREYFAAKHPTSTVIQLLDFGKGMLGREEELHGLQKFVTDKVPRVCIVSGRGGIGKSKLLHDWALGCESPVLFLR